MNQETITFQEFKAWLTGLIVGKRGVLPDLDDWKEIKKMLDKTVADKETVTIPQPYPVGDTPFITPQPAQPTWVPTTVPSTTPYPFQTWCVSDSSGGDFTISSGVQSVGSVNLENATTSLGAVSHQTNVGEPYDPQSLTEDYYFACEGGIGEVQLQLDLDDMDDMDEQSKELGEALQALIDEVENNGSA